MTELPRRIPPVNSILECPPLPALIGRFDRERVVNSVRAELDDLRKQSREGSANDLLPESIAQRAADRLVKSDRPIFCTVINATGIVLHTNLGRAPLAEVAAQAAFDAARRYLNLEMSLETGNRSSRQDAVRHWLCQLTGAESATVVNNCAAATVIVLRTLAAGREAIVSRGQLIEIGGSFRIPDIMAVSGATLREVGTTNITRISDFERAVGPDSALLMRIHTSNYRITGFTESPTLEELVTLGRRLNLTVVDDVGSGALFDYSRLGFNDEPLIRDSIAAGADVVLFSGDKLLGGPQAGIIVGRSDIIQRIERDPLMRAFRLDKMTLAALEATLRLYLDESRAISAVPVLRLLHMGIEELRLRAHRIASEMRGIDGLAVQVDSTQSFVGGGSLPEQSMPSVVISLQMSGMTEQQLTDRLRTGEPSVLGRAHQGNVLLDLRTVFPDQEADLVAAVRKAVSDKPGATS